MHGQPHIRFRSKTFFFHGATTTRTLGPPYCRGFTITLRPTTLGRTSVDVRSARRRHFYLTTLNTQPARDIHVTGGFRTRNPRTRATANQRFTSHVHWDPLQIRHCLKIIRMLMIIFRCCLPLTRFLLEDGGLCHYFRSPLICSS